MTKFVNFLRQWQAVCDGDTAQSRAFMANPDNHAHIRRINWIVTAVVCVGMLYMFTQSI